MDLSFYPDNGAPAEKFVSFNIESAKDLSNFSFRNPIIASTGHMLGKRYTFRGRDFVIPENAELK